MSNFVWFALQYLTTLGWALTGALSMGLGLGLALRLFAALTPGIDELEELKKGNLAVAIVLAAVIVAMGVVVAIVIMPEGLLPSASK